MQSRQWKDWMNNANTTSKMTHTMLMETYTLQLVKFVKDYISKMAGEWAEKDEKLKGKNKLRGLVPYPFDFKHTVDGEVVDFKHNDDGEVDDELIALKHPLWEELALYREGRYDPDMFNNIPKKKDNRPYRVDVILKSISEKLKAWSPC